MKTRTYLRTHFLGRAGRPGGAAGTALRLFPAFLSALVAASCAGDEAIPDAYGPGTVKFRIGGDEVTAERSGMGRENDSAAARTRKIDLPATFLVSAYEDGSGGEYFNFSGTLAAPGIVDTGRRWPAGGTLSFFAYAPSDLRPDTWSSRGGTFSFTADGTSDPMFAASGNRTDPGAAETPVPLVFRHALSAIRFLKGTTAAGVTIKSVSVGGVLPSGDCDVSFGDGGETVTFGWTPSGTVRNYEIVRDGEDLSAIPQGVRIGEDLSVIPQDASNVVATVDLVQTVSGKALNFTVTEPLGTASWEPGKMYKYTVNVGSHADDPLHDTDVTFDLSITGVEAYSFHYHGCFFDQDGYETREGSWLWQDDHWELYTDNNVEELE